MEEEIEEGISRWDVGSGIHQENLWRIHGVVIEFADLSTATLVPTQTHLSNKLPRRPSSLIRQRNQFELENNQVTHLVD